MPASGRPELRSGVSVACTPGTSKGLWLSVLHSMFLTFSRVLPGFHSGDHRRKVVVGFTLDVDPIVNEM